LAVTFGQGTSFGELRSFAGGGAIRSA